MRGFLKDVEIVIPSSGRAERQTTLTELPDRAAKKVRIALPEDEVEQYHYYWPRVRLLPVPLKYRGISQTRKYLFEWCQTNYLLMLDDDMQFCYRPDMNSPRLQKIPPKSHRLENLLYYWRGLMSQYCHVGLSARQGNNHVSTSVKECCRMFNAYMYDMRGLRREKIQFARVKVMEDFDVTLQLLRKGIPNAVIYRWCWRQPGSNGAGGCSQYRTAEMQQEAARQLARLHLGFVTVVEKQSSEWHGMYNRADVRVYWQRAYKSAFIK